MDAQSLRRALFDLFKFDPKDFYVRGSGTSFLVSSSNRKGGAVDEIWPFQGYKSNYSGTGTPPDNQPFRIRVRPGAVNTIKPSNNNEEFICPPSATTFFYILANFTSVGVLTSATIEQAATVPVDPEGSPDDAPPTSSCPIFEVVTDSDRVKEIHPFRKTSLNVGARITNVGCSDNTLAYFWV